MQKIFFIGAGSMAEALLNGWLANNVFSPEQLYVSNRSNDARLHMLQQTYGVQRMETLEQLADAHLIVLAMKPKDARVAMDTIAPYIASQAIVLSVLAGVSIETIATHLGERPIARAMPNTSAKIGMGATGIAFNPSVTPALRTLLLQMLEAVGIVHEVPEDKLHAITALSGSGPAYLYYLLEAFESVALEYELPTSVVRELMVQTMAGAAAMLQQTNEEPAVLRRHVTSPGGTTEAGIATLTEQQFCQAVADAVRSAERRSRELANLQD